MKKQKRLNFLFCVVMYFLIFLSCLVYLMKKVYIISVSLCLCVEVGVYRYASERGQGEEKKGGGGGRGDQMVLMEKLFPNLAPPPTPTAPLKKGKNRKMWRNMTEKVNTVLRCSQIRCSFHVITNISVC